MELMDLKKFAVDVTLDPNTSHPWLVLSEDLKSVYEGDMKKDVRDNSQRFDNICCVFGKQSFSSGKSYLEVQVKGKYDWWIGVARESVDRKGDLTLSPQNGLWGIGLCEGGSYIALTDPDWLHLSLKSRPQKVGVFVDYDKGIVSFYDVDTEKLIYSFTGCCFTEKIYPFLYPQDSTPLILTEVKK